jgi:hypothetical protein
LADALPIKRLHKAVTPTKLGATKPSALGEKLTF